LATSIIFGDLLETFALVAFLAFSALLALQTSDNTALNAFVIIQRKPLSTLALPIHWRLIIPLIKVAFSAIGLWKASFARTITITSLALICREKKKEIKTSKANKLTVLILASRTV
jgi:hypothetical protein